MKQLSFTVLVWLLLMPAAQAVEVQVVTSKGGLVAWLVEDNTVPAVTVSVLVRGAGTAYDPPSKQGRAMLAASLLTEGAGSRDSAAFHDALDFHAIRWAASASMDDLDLSVTSLTEHTELAFSLLHDALAAPHFAAPDMARMKALQITDIKENAGDAGYQSARGMYAALFPDHPYGHPASGTLESVAALTREDMLAYQATHLRRRAIILSVSGNMAAATLKSRMETYLDTLPAPEESSAPLAEVKPVFGSAQGKVMQVPQTVVSFALPGVARKDQAYFAAFIANHLFGGNGLSSRLGHEIREKRGLAYYAYSGLVDLDRAPLLTGSFATRNDQVAEAVATLKEVVTTLGKEGFSEEEFAEGVQYLIGSFPAKLTSNRSVAEYLEAMQRYDLGRDYLEKRNDYVAAVTCKEVNDLTKRLFKPENLVIMTAGKPANAVLNKEKSE